MVTIGNFFFKYRNLLFIFLYLALFIPSPDIFTPEIFGENYYWWPIIIGLVVTVSGQAIRGATIGLAYIIRGGKDKKVYAEKLVTEGIFNHCRNPLYVGNILMLLGVGILSNSLIYVGILIPLFLFIYQAIVLAEENFLRNKFGAQFDAYCQRVNRWIPSLKGISKTFEGMHFNANRWILKEYNTQFVWLVGITLILLFKYPQLTNSSEETRNSLLYVILPALLVIYLFVKYLKKTGKMVA
ncbi:methyltransferase family protein [Adhaeribacter radiodurans]|uniref:Isoprenylcysteine carboxylmethyltransferase family protein n=1 Tax=Adhaeribacter radiodurans TaxID=2745197 RepID=A0A7L7LCL6_9BACT|nr:isoprenylcysteine carboxylmethyltransferase family protein [Adhaeribacter radiodurans]QMU30561.1 isoprenylcysteine carboxylmethyltransferase family protein [Adhaeribacter radiodurans]